MVKITQVETNQIRETQTTADGTYTFPTIPPGTYEVEISREGFQTITRRDIPVTINIRFVWTPLCRLAPRRNR